MREIVMEHKFIVSGLVERAMRGERGAGRALIL